MSKEQPARTKVKCIHELKAHHKECPGKSGRSDLPVAVRAAHCMSDEHLVTYSGA